MAKDRADSVGTIISTDCTFEGNIKLESSIRIDGTHIGDVTTVGDIFIGDKGTCTGNLDARNIYICGKVNGDVLAQGRIELSSKSILMGNATMGNLVMEEGAEFVGSCRTINTLEQAKTQVEAKEEKA